jgi:hypothetical protein
LHLVWLVHLELNGAETSDEMQARPNR